MLNKTNNAKEPTAVKDLHSTRGLLSTVFLCTFIYALNVGTAHDVWVLTPDQIADWNARALPSILTQINVSALMLFVVAAVFLLGWTVLGPTNTKELFRTAAKFIGSLVGAYKGRP